ncbi:MAG: hypothetical protein IPM54_21730 [Polyangiaceae bacterium]|nr:hypothetical protein [Polyangiaceae bacterium]
MMRRICSLALSLGLLVAGALGCVGSSDNTPVTQAPPAKPKNAADIARSIVNARVGVMVWAERLHGQPIEMRLQAMNPLRPMLDGTGIDATRDVVAAYVASTGITSNDVAVAIVQHKVDPPRLQMGLETVMARSVPRGEWITGASVPSARVTVRGQTRVVAIVEPEFLAVLPEGIASQASRFVGTGGFVDPVGPDVMVATALDPSRSLSAAHVPPIPPTIRAVEAHAWLASDGGLDIHAVGESTDPMQASADASALTTSIDNATSINLGIVKVRLFQPVVFRAEGQQVKSQLHLTQTEIDRLAALAETFIPR